MPQTKSTWETGPLQCTAPGSV